MDRQAHANTLRLRMYVLCSECVRLIDLADGNKPQRMVEADDLVEHEAEEYVCWLKLLGIDEIQGDGVRARGAPILRISCRAAARVGVAGLPTCAPRFVILQEWSARRASTSLATLSMSTVAFIYSRRDRLASTPNRRSLPIQTLKARQLSLTSAPHSLELLIELSRL